MVADVKLTLGPKSPLFVEFISNTAEASGEVVPIPTCAYAMLEEHNNPIINSLTFIIADSLICKTGATRCEAQKGGSF